MGFNEEYIRVFEEVTEYANFLKVLKSNILEADEYQEVIDKKGNVVNAFLKKSGYYKLKKAFGVQIELVDWKYHVNERGSLRWCWFHVVGILPTGERMDAFGACDSTERGKKGANDIIATAHTRANLRAISQLIDFGSVSSDEIAVLEKGD